MSLNNPLSLPPAPYAQPMVDPKSGIISPEWVKWFQVLQVRVGGATAAPIAGVPNTPPVDVISNTAPLIAAAMYTVPIGQKLIINSFSVLNLDNTPRTVSVWLVQPGDSANNANLVISAQPIASRARYLAPQLQFQVLNGGGSIVVLGSVENLLNVNANGRLSS